MSSERSWYWAGTGKYQEMCSILTDMVPPTGTISGSENKKLEQFRKASCCYYDLYNNGLCNRGEEFKSVFGFRGKYIANLPPGANSKSIPKLEAKLDQIILEAGYEQRLAQAVAIIEGEKLIGKIDGSTQKNAPSV